MIEAALGSVILGGLVGGMAPVLTHHRISIKWFIGLIVLGLVGLLLAQGLPLDVSDLIEVK